MEQQVWAEVITVGSELVLGQLVDTNAPYIAAKLSEIGVGLAYHTTVGDDAELMRRAFELALDRCQIVITTGGIGPTEDDLTREIAAQIMGVDLELRPDLLEFIENLFKKMNYKMAPNNRKQAYLPAGARAIHNPRGTAPAFACEKDDRILICLPGVPWETEPLIVEEVLPLLQKKYNPGGRIWVNRVLKVCGVGESNVDAQLKDIIRSSKNPTIGLQASPGEIKVRLTARAENRTEADRLLDEGEARIVGVLGELIFGREEETLSGVAASLIEAKGLTIAVVEALTGGAIVAELGRRLKPGRLKGGLILEEPRPAPELCERALGEFRPDLVLAVAGRPGEEEGRFEVDILVRTTDGREASRSLSLGGSPRIIAARSSTMGLFTLWSFLRNLEQD